MQNIFLPIRDRQVEEIKRRLNAGAKHLELAEQFNVTRRNINYIANDKTWIGPRCTSLEITS